MFDFHVKMKEDTDLRQFALSFISNNRDHGSKTLLNLQKPTLEKTSAII